MKYATKGFSLIEVLVALAVMATGLLAVASFQTDLLTNSGTNKARSEALALAQARIEQFRNYTLQVGDRDSFDSVFAATNGSVTDTYPDGQGGTTTTYHGNNADFTRSYTISGGTRATKSLQVLVAWTDRQGDAQSVTLNTEIGWESPRTLADIANDDREPEVPSATGRAHLGEGTLPDNVNPDNLDNNGDGTKLYEDGSGDLKLVVGTDIVLTLEEACQSMGNCLNFVKIHGRVYIDTTSQTNLSPGQVYVKASDAAYCHRYYTTTSGANTTVHDVTSSTTSTNTTANGHYEYFDYTCYLGGGWHGNVGIILASGISQNDKICQGDPISENAWEQPVISARRVYRGMLYKHASGGGREMITKTLEDGTTNTQVRYYSVGIADSIELPAAGEPTHDFVIARMNVSDTTGDKCIDVSTGPMMRGDSTVDSVTGKLFAGMPTDFVCLNQQASYLDDAYDDNVYGADNTCPYDPSDPPTLRHVVSGILTVAGPAEIASYVAGMGVVTSDGPGNCSVAAATFLSDTYTVAYTCDVYNWGNGWTGYIEVKPNSDDISCEYYRLTHSGVTADTGSQNFSCSGGDFVIIRGTVTSPNHTKVLSSASISDPNGVCTVSNGSYECRTSTLAEDDWDGSITFTATNGVLCHDGVTADNPITVSYYDMYPGAYTDNFSIANNAGSCP